MKKNNYIILILLFGIALTLTITAITIHFLNNQIANLLWGTSLGGLADVKRYIQWERLTRIYGLIAILFYASVFGYIVILKTTIKEVK